MVGGGLLRTDALVEHVARDGGLGRCDPQTLREDTAPVGEPRAMPEQLPIAQVLGEGGILAVALDLERLEERELVLAVGLGVRILQVVVEHRVQRRRRVDGRQM